MGFKQFVADVRTLAELAPRAAEGMREMARGGEEIARAAEEVAKAGDDGKGGTKSTRKGGGGRSGADNRSYDSQNSVVILGPNGEVVSSGYIPPLRPGTTVENPYATRPWTDHRMPDQRWATRAPLDPLWGRVGFGETGSGGRSFGSGPGGPFGGSHTGGGGGTGDAASRMGPDGRLPRQQSGNGVDVGLARTMESVTTAGERSIAESVDRLGNKIDNLARSDRNMWARREGLI